jgi:predicted dehydrogenase
MIGVAVVGCGYWGPNLARNFSALPGSEVRAICDLDPSRVERLRHFYPAVRGTTEFQDLLEASDVDALAICTPVQTHHPLAAAALEAGKHVLVEKPLTHSVATARKLVERARELGLTLQVDHTYVYSGAVQKLRSIIDDGMIGDLLYFDSVRINLGLFQDDVSVVWDLAPHDLSVLSYLVDRTPVSVSAIGRTHFSSVETQAYLTLQFDDSLIAHLHVNWLAPVKIRSTVIGGSKRMIVYDDLAPSEKIRIYDKGVTVKADAGRREEAMIDYRVGDMYAPYIDKTEPLARVCSDFLEAIATGKPPLTDGRSGIEVVRIVEAAEASMRKNGEWVELEPLS